MAHYFKYDRNQNKHHIYTIPIRNQKNEFVGYRAVVYRVKLDKILTEKISDFYPGIKWKIFTGENAEKECRKTAIEFFENLKPTIK